jgi:FkbM family methyltransferase
MPLTDQQLQRLRLKFPTLSVGRDCTVINSIFGEHVTLGAGAMVEWSILGEGSTIGDRTMIHSARVGKGVKIGSDCRIEAGSVVTDGAHIPSGSHIAGIGKIDPALRAEVLEQLPLVQVHQQWVADAGEQTHRINYPLTPRDVVLDVGGYLGEWAEVIIQRNHPVLHVFEPVPAYAAHLRTRLTSQATVHEFGLAGRTREEAISIASESSSVLRSAAGAQKQVIRLVAAAEILRDLPAEIALLKINIEGGEFELLEHLIAEKLLPRFRFLQIQFHDFVPRARERRQQLREVVARTHAPTYNYPFIWEGWTRR